MGRRALRAQGSVSPDPGPPEAWIDDTLILEVWDPERWGVVRRGGCEGPGLPTWSLGRKTCATGRWEASMWRELVLPKWRSRTGRRKLARLGKAASNNPFPY